MDYLQPFEFTDKPEFTADDYVAEVPSGLTTTEALLQVLYDRLDLPGYFGFNWNALSDCLRDFHWLQQSRVVLRHTDLPPIPLTDLRSYLGVLADAVVSWAAGEEHSLTVVFPAAAKRAMERLMNDDALPSDSVSERTSGS